MSTVCDLLWRLPNDEVPFVMVNLQHKEVE